MAITQGLGDPIGLGQIVQYHPLENSFEGAGPINGVKPCFCEVFLCPVRKRKVDIFLTDELLHSFDLNTHYLREQLSGKRVEDNDIVYPVQKLRLELIAFGDVDSGLQKPI